MILKVLGSGSSGNCYILESDTEALIIEAGVPLKEVKIALGFNIRKIVGVVVSHSHGDHAKYVSEYEKEGISVYKSYEGRLPFDVYGNFFFKDFELEHDVPCVGFYIRHPEIGVLVYASDTEYIKWRFKDINHILVEANYSDDLIEKDAVNREHVLKGHMSLKTALDFISTNDNPTLKNVVLLHISEKNGNPVEFQKKVQKILKYDSRAYAAHKGLEINLNLIPF